MFDRISSFVVTMAAGALGAAAVVAPFVHAWGQSLAETRLAAPVAFRGQRPREGRGRTRPLPGADQRLQRLPHGRLHGHRRQGARTGLARRRHAGLAGAVGHHLRAQPATYFQATDEEGWLAEAHHRAFRPPMPAPSLRAMTDEDLRAIYRYVRALGPAGKQAPAYVPPGQHAAGPVVVFPAPPQ